MFIVSRLVWFGLEVEDKGPVWCGGRGVWETGPEKRKN